MLELRQVQEAETKESPVLSANDEDSEKVREIFGEDKPETKPIEINPISFGKKLGDAPVISLTKDPLEIEKEAAAIRLDSGESSKLLSSKAFIILVVAVVALHAMFAYFIQTSNKTPQFASIGIKQNIETQPSSETNINSVLGNTQTGVSTYETKQEQKKPEALPPSSLSAAELGQLAPGAGTPVQQNSNNKPTPTQNPTNNNNNGELKDSDILNILRKTD